MKTGKAVLIGMSVIAGSILLNLANAQVSSGNGKFLLSSSDGVVYRMNSQTGEISYCIGYKEKVECTRWAK